MSVLGIDIAKDKFDVTLVKEDKKKVKGKFKNQEKGFEQLHRWLQKHATTPVHVCMESTNVYWEELAQYLYEKAYQVSVVNPMRIKGYAHSQMRRSKTDTLDADVIADFCLTQTPNSWTPLTTEEYKIRALVRHLDALNKERTQLKNRFASSREPEVQNSLEKLLDMLETEMATIEKRINTIIAQHPELKEKKRLLTSIKGIGSKTANCILAEMPHLDQYENAKAVAADAGITTSHYSSGSSVRRRPRMSRMGKVSIRAALHFPAMVAIKHNLPVKKLASRLKAKGKKGIVINVAAMRKLMHIVYGVLKNKTEFDPHYGTPSTALVQT